MKRAISQISTTTDMSADIGLIGLAVMGENLILNMASKGVLSALFVPLLCHFAVLTL
jgi:6-phosphogluconate dehydrogenase